MMTNKVTKMNSQVAGALKELAKQFKEAWPDHTGKYHFLIGAGHNIAKALATPAPIPDVGEAVEVVGYAADFEGQQGEVVTGLFSTNATFRRCPPDFGEPRELMTVAQHNRIVSALQASAMVVPDGYALVKLDTLARWESELDQIAGAGHISDELIRMLAASTAPGDSQ